MPRKFLALLLSGLILLNLCACTDNNTAVSRSAFAYDIDRESKELVLTYPDAHTLRINLTDKLMFEGREEGEFDLVACGVSAAAWGDTSAVFIPASYYFPKQPNLVKISRDNGQTWQDIPIPQEVEGLYNSVLGFKSPDSIWLLQEGDRFLGHASLYLYTSEDGGQTWTYTQLSGYTDGYPIDEALPLDYITFITPDEGYLAVGAGMLGPNPLIYQTTDGGRTWQAGTIQSKVQNDYFQIEDIHYYEDMLIMTGRLIKGGYLTLTSPDGLSWRQI